MMKTTSKMRTRKHVDENDDECCAKERMGMTTNMRRLMMQMVKRMSTMMRMNNRLMMIMRTRKTNMRNRKTRRIMLRKMIR